MEVSVRLIDENESTELAKKPDAYIIETTEIGNAYIPKDGVIVTGPIRIRYEKHPWIEQFELDGIKAASPVRKGIGTKDMKGFVQSLSTIYAKAFEDYDALGDDARRYFGHAAEYFEKVAEQALGQIDERTSERPSGMSAGNLQMKRLFLKFAGLTENMWREGNEEMLDAAVNVIIPAMRRKECVWKLFDDGITAEFRGYLEEHSSGFLT